MTRVVIAVLILPSSVAIVADKVVVPVTTAAKTAARTRAYSSMSWPDSSRWNWLTNCLNVIRNLLHLDFYCVYIPQRQDSRPGDPTPGTEDCALSKARRRPNDPGALEA